MENEYSRIEKERDIIDALDEGVKSCIAVKESPPRYNRLSTDNIPDTPCLLYRVNRMEEQNKTKETVESTIQDDEINHPSHYTRGSIEVLDFIEDQEFDFLEGNVIKYVSRYKFKDGLKDLEKAEFYLNRLIKRESGK